jgi:hypothetical protein
MGSWISFATTTLTVLIACGGGGGGSPDAAAMCDQACRDAAAVRSLREAIKVAYNATLQGKPVGMQDQMTNCPLDGSAHVFGTATSNGAQGTTDVQLTYVFTKCTYSQTSSDPTQTFAMAITGTVMESGTIAVQPSATTSLQFHSSAMKFSGTVFYPPIPYQVSTCAVDLGQNGNDVSGMLCGRPAGVNL